VAVLVDSGPVNATQRREDVPVNRWHELVAVRRDFCSVKLSYDCRELLHFVDDAPEMLAPLGYTDVKDFISRGLELDPDMVDWALKGLKRLQPNEPIPFKRAVHFGKHGGDRGNQHTGGKRQDDIIILPKGTSRAYLLARLHRDHPELAARVDSGELRAYGAAKLAGIISVKSPLEQLRHWWRKADVVAQQAFREEIAG